ncbi:MAG: helix-turn-helix transcriptional regulator [Thermodesulfobacteriota bacterium]
MPNKKYSEKQKEIVISSFVGEFITDASDEELDELIQLQGGDPLAYIEKSKRAITGALEQVSKENKHAIEENDDCKTIHLVLGKLLTMLRRKEQISEEELAERARVDVAEIRKIEYDIDYLASPRTIIQLEKYFKLPDKVLAKLSGAFVKHTYAFRQEVTRFAAKMKTIDNLTSEEMELLNNFIRFLSKNE